MYADLQAQMTIKHFIYYIAIGYANGADNQDVGQAQRQIAF